jgi:hypothetical protein
MIRYLLLAAGLILVAVLVAHAGVGQVLGLLQRAWWALPVVVALYTLHTVLRAVALWQCLRANGTRLPFRDVLTIRFSAEAVEMLTFTGPFLAEPAKTMLLKERGLALGEAVAGVLAEYVLYTFAAAAIAVAAAVWLLAAFPLPPMLVTVTTAFLVAMGVLVAGVAAIIAFRIPLVAPLVRLVARLPWIGGHIPGGAVAGAARIDNVLVDLARDRPARLAEIVATELAGHVLLMGEVAVVLVALGLWKSPAYPLLIEGGAKFTNGVFFFVPGQVGALEGTQVVMFRLLGLQPAAGLTLALARRVRGLITGGIGLAAVSLTAGRPARPTPER